MQDEPGCTPLHWAVNEDFRGSHREMVELLIDRGADVNARDDTLTTPLHMASNKETAELLIDAGADVNAKDSEGKTILYSTARNAANASKTWDMYLGLVELLIARGADVNVKDHSGETPLHVVARQYDEKKASEICELLITNGARVNEPDSKGQTPLDHALANQRTATAEVLRKHGGQAGKSICKPARDPRPMSQPSLTSLSDGVARKRGERGVIVQQPVPAVEDLILRLPASRGLGAPPAKAPGTLGSASPT